MVLATPIAVDSELQILVQTDDLCQGLVGDSIDIDTATVGCIDWDFAVALAWTDGDSRGCGQADGDDAGEP